METTSNTTSTLQSELFLELNEEHEYDDTHNIRSKFFLSISNK